MEPTVWVKRNIVDLSEDSIEAYAFVLAKEARNTILTKLGTAFVPLELQTRVKKITKDKAEVDARLVVGLGNWDEGVFTALRDTARARLRSIK